MLNTNETDRTTAENAPLSEEIKNGVRAELELILGAPIFAQSNRCKSFLSYVVLQTLMGRADQLKERTIGIGVFERAPDYDTGEDSIVRVTANEVRKRLGQFYRESTSVHRIQLELPRGAYVPGFRIHASRVASGIKEAALETAEGEIPLLTQELPATGSQISPPTSEGTKAEPASVAVAPSQQSRIRTRIFYGIIFLILVFVAAFGLLSERFMNRSPDLWGPFMHSRSPVLVCIDTHALAIPGSGSLPTEGQTFVDMVLRKQIIALDDAAVLSSMAAVLGKKGIAFRVVGAEQTSLSDLRRQPVILIGAIDNKWTIRLTEGLRYRIEVENPPNSGAEKAPVASIVDSQHPDTRWTTDLGVPFNSWKTDYAVISRADDITTGVPVLIAAGLGNDGTLAASELITLGGLSPILANEPSCRDKRNFEAVIETQIIDTKSGPPHVLRLTCW